MNFRIGGITTINVFAETSHAGAILCLKNKVTELKADTNRNADIKLIMICQLSSTFCIIRYQIAKFSSGVYRQAASNIIACNNRNSDLIQFCVKIVARATEIDLFLRIVSSEAE